MTAVIDQASAGLINHAGKRDLIEKLEPGISKQDLDRRCDRTFAGTLAGYAQNRAVSSSDKPPYKSHFDCMCG